MVETAFSPYDPFQKEEEAQGPTEYSPFPTTEESVKAEGKTPSQSTRTVDLAPSVTSSSREEAAIAVSVGEDRALENEAKGFADQAQVDTVNEVISKGAQDGTPPEEVILSLSEQISTNPFLSTFVDPVVMSTVLTSKNQFAIKREVSKLKKVLIFQDAMERRKSKATGTEKFFENAADFGDQLFTSIIPVYNIMNVTERKEFAKEVSLLMSSDMDDEEFAIRVEEIMDVAQDQGVFTENNAWIMDDFFMLLGEGGQGTSAEIQTFFAWFDTLTVAGDLLRAPVRAVGGALTRQAMVKDTATLLARTGRSADEIQDIFEGTIRADNPETAATSVSVKGQGADTPAFMSPTRLSAPENQAMQAIEDSNEVLAAIRHHVGAQAIDDEVYLNLKDKIVEEMASASERNGSKRMISNDIVRLDLENLIYTEEFGTSKGAYFKSQDKAQQLADDIGGYITEVEGNQWAVIKETNVPLAPGGGNSVESLRLFVSTKPEELGDGFWAKFGSPASQTTDRLNSILKQGEAYRDQVLSQADNNIRKIEKKLWRHNKMAVNRVFTKIGEGVDSWRKSPYSYEEFKQNFQSLNGRRATQAEEEYYFALQERNDAAYFLQADIEFKNAVNQGQEVLLEEGFERRVIRQTKESIPETDLVWDLDSKKLISKDQISDKANVYSAVDDTFSTPFGEEVQFVVKRGATTRRLYHTDVLNYNPGGARVYVNNSVKFFVKQDRKAIVAGGREVHKEPITFMGVRLEAEAKQVQDELNRIIAAVNAKVPDKKDAINALKVLGEDADLVKVIRANNTWNPSIQGVDDLVKFAKRSNISLTDNVTWLPDGSRLSEAGDKFLPGVNPASSIVESFNIQSIGKGGRKQEVLLGFGGKINSIEPKVDTIKQGFAQAAAKRSETAYTMAAVNGLIKELLREGGKALKNPAVAQKDLVGLPLRSKLSKLKEHINVNSEEGAKLALERDKIEFRLNKKTAFAQGWDNVRDDFADWMYGKGWERTAETVDRWSGDPVAAFKGYTFDIFLGLGAWRQYYVQSSQVFNIVPVAGLAGIKGVSSYPFVRFAVANGNKSVIEATANRMAPILGLKPSQFVEMVEMLRENGRLVTNLSIAELGEDSAFTGGLQGVRKAGRFFFNEGELTARISAHSAAYISYLEKFGKESAATQHGRRWITGEADRLTQSMTSASRSPYQQAPGVQFLTYTWRMTEQMLAGSIGGGKRILSNKEKTKMLTTHVAMYGLTGLGITNMTDRWMAEGDLPIDEDTYRKVRNGLVDVALSGLLDAETALSGDLAWAQGLADTIKNLSEANLVEAVVGPSGEVVSNTFDHFTSVLVSMASGSPELVKQDLTLLARQIKSVDMSYNAWIGWRLGLYVARNGEGVVSDNIDKGQAIALGLGIPLDKVEKGYTLSRVMYEDSQHVKETVKTFKKMWATYDIAIREGDTDTRDKVGKQIGLFYRALPPRVQQQAFSAVSAGRQSKLDTVGYWALRNGLEATDLLKGEQE